MKPFNRSLLNHLQHLLPEGLLADAAWFERMGYSSSLRRRYVDTGWLERIVRGVYLRPAYLPGVPETRMPLDWRQVVVSLQMVMHRPLVVGGRSALELNGYAHVVGLRGMREIHLYGDEAPPHWLRALPIPTEIVCHNAGRLFPGGAAEQSLGVLRNTLASDIVAEPQDLHDGLAWQRTGDERWPMMVSAPERAVLELLEELPHKETFEQADMLMEGLFSLRPQQMSDLLRSCRSVKAKRLLLWFAERHGHAWSGRVDMRGISLGSGKRMLVPGGRLDRKYGITVPARLIGNG